MQRSSAGIETTSALCPRDERDMQEGERDQCPIYISDTEDEGSFKRAGLS